MTFHVRVVSPPDLTDPLVDVRVAHSGVAVVAVLAGIVGVVSLTESRAGALIGVFISITTIPAASDMGLSMAYASWTQARGSTFQLLLNVTLLIVMGALVLRVQRIIWRPRSAG